MAGFASDKHTAPRGGIDIGNRLRERPAMAPEILGRVLPFPVRVVGGCVHDSRAVRGRVLVMCVGVLDSHVDGGPGAIATGQTAPSP